MDKQLDTDNLSIYDLPTLNAVISKYEDPKPKDEVNTNSDLQYPQYK